MRQGEITFTMSISTFMKNGNLRLDYFLEFKVGAGVKGSRRRMNCLRTMTPVASGESRMAPFLSLLQ